MIDKRISDMIRFFRKHPKTNYSELEKELSINPSQIKYSLKKLNEFLMEHSIEEIDEHHHSLFINNKQHEFLVQISTDLLTQQYIFNSEERLKLIFLILVAKDDDYISMAHFLELLEVGKTTLSQDIKELTRILVKESIYLDYSRQTGYILVGDELKIRQLLFRWIISDFSLENRFVYTFYLKYFRQIELENVISDIQKLNEPFGIHFVEDRFAEFSCFFLLILNRMKDYSLTYHIDGEFNFEQFKEYRFAKCLYDTFDLQKEKELSYLCAWVLGQSIGNLNEETPDRSLILEIVEGIIRRFEKLSGLAFLERNKVLYQLYGHFRPCYYRLVFKFPVVNQLVSKIKSEYRDIFYLVSETVKRNDGVFSTDIPEDEIAYLTIHFASAIEQNGRKFNGKAIRAIVVCSNGIGSSAIVFEELRSLFTEIFFMGPVDLEEFRKLDLSDIDLIFSTKVEKEMLEARATVFFINPIMTTAEKYNLIRNVYSKIGHYQLPDIDKILSIIDKHSQVVSSEHLKKELMTYLTQSEKIDSSEIILHLSDLLPAHRIQKISRGKNLSEIMTLLAQPLLEDGLIELGYLEAVEKEFEDPRNTFHIAPGVLLPHTKPENGSLGIGMSLGILEEEILVNQKRVRYIFFLSAVDNKRHLSAMADLVKLVTNPELSGYLNVQSHLDQILTFIKNSEV